LAAPAGVRVTRTTLRFAGSGCVDQSVPGGAVDQADRAVVAQDQVAGEIADRGAGRIGMALDRQQQLVPGRGQPGRPGLLLAPAQEPPEPSAQFEQVFEISLVKRDIAYIA
jgi:hypothetical protein